MHGTAARTRQTEEHIRNVCPRKWVSDFRKGGKTYISTHYTLHTEMLQAKNIRPLVMYADIWRVKTSMTLALTAGDSPRGKCLIFMNSSEELMWVRNGHHSMWVNTNLPWSLMAVNEHAHRHTCMRTHAHIHKWSLSSTLHKTLCHLWNIYRYIYIKYII